MVSGCSTCLTYRNHQQSEGKIEHEIPDTPWNKVATDLFTIYGKGYVIAVDYFSKFFKVALVNKPVDSPAVVKALRRTFARHSIPRTLFSDGGPQYAAIEFTKFAKGWDFKHDMSSPHSPESNGLVEHTIQTVKTTLKKANKSSKDVYLALLLLITTPRKVGRSPAFKLFHSSCRK